MRRETVGAGIQSVITNYIIDNILFGGREDLPEDLSFQDGGILDSTGLLDMVIFLEERFGIEIADDEVVPENLGTLRRMSAYVERKMKGQTAAS